MTAVVALVEKNKIYMGADSAGACVSTLSITVRKDPKVFKNGPFLMGFTDSFRMGQLLHYSFDPPEQPKGMPDDVFMNTVFVNTIRDCLKTGGYAQTDRGVETGGTFLVGYKKNLYRIGFDYQVGISALKYDAIGCGHNLCKGSMYSTSKLKMEPKKRITLALKAAETFSMGVVGPFTILSI